MHFLFRLFIGVFLVWLICRFFYSLGRKSALKDDRKKPASKQKRKRVDSTVVEKDNKPDKY